MFVSCECSCCQVEVCDGPVSRPEESYRLWCVFECDQVKIKTPYTYCEQVGRRGKDYEMKLKYTATTVVNFKYLCK
jgi:hypothetical protein